MNEDLRELASTLQQVVHRMASEDPELKDVLQRNLSHGELEILIQDLSEAGRKAQSFRPTVRARIEDV